MTSRTLPPIARGSGVPAQTTADEERPRKDSINKGQRKRSSSTPKPPAAPKPPVPLRVLFPSDADREACDGNTVLVEPLGASAADFAAEFRLQWRQLEESEEGSSKDFQDIDFQVQGRSLALVLPVQGLVQLRAVQRAFPDNIAAWNDWTRTARKEPAWLSRCSAPFLVHVPPLEPPAVSLEVSEPDGASLVACLVLAFPSCIGSWLEEGLHWQYCWCNTYSEDWQYSGWFEAVLEDNLTLRPPPLREDWRCTSLKFAVRYRVGVTLSTWSGEFRASFPYQEQVRISVTPSRAMLFTEAALAVDAVAVMSGAVRKVQCRVEISQVGEAWETVVVEQLSEAKFSCQLRYLQPGECYKVRVSTRRLGIDAEWRENLEEFRQPLSGAEQGVPPIKAVPDEMLVGEIPSLEPQEPTYSWYSFWLPPMMASWVAECFSAEWRNEEAGSWQLASSSKAKLRHGLHKDATFADGSGLRVLLPDMAARVLVRIRHVCGPVSASVAVVPQFLPPEMLSARLLVQDAGLAIQLMARSCSSEQCHAAVLQFKVRAESSKGSREAQKMLQERSIVGKAASIEDQQFIVDIEELGMLSDQEQVAFCARIGDSCRKSDWSSEQQLKLRVPAPRARGALTVCQLGPGVAEVLWPLFEPAAGLKDVHYEVTATCSCFPEERQQLTIPAGGPGHAVLSGLVADTDYVVKVRGRYPWLGRFQDEGGSNIALKAHFRTLGVDTEDCEPPLAVRQVAPPADHGGVDLRSPWSSEFWLEVDPRALGETATHRVEWRPAILRGLDRQGGWQTAAVRSQGKCGKAALCTWDLEDLKDLKDLEVESGLAQVEAVEFRCRRLQCEDSDGLLSSRTWVSRSSGPFATGFAAPEKPKALLAGRLELVLSFALRTELLPKSAGSGVGALEPEPESRSPGHGHRLATRMQLCCRQAGDAHEQDDVQEFPARVLPEAEGSNGWRLCTVTIPVRQPQFREGQRQLFAVRVGDSCRWSAWSGFSKPVHMTAPALQPPQASLTVTPLPPARVRLQWPCFWTDFGDAVEYFLSLAQVGPAGREVKASSQLIALVGETDASSGNVMEVEVGHMDAGTPLQFKVLARAQCHLLGAPQFAEVARSEVMWPPTPGPLSDLAPESWDLPATKVLPVPEGLEAGGGRWRGRAALLSWPWGVEISEDPPLELQACNVLGDVCHAYAWTAVTWSLIYLNARPCVAASPLPFARCRFRWYSVDRRIAGPCSEPCLTYVDTPTEVAGEVFCTVAAVRVRASFVPSDAVQNGELLFGQWRCGRTARRNEDGEEIWSPVEKWHVLDQKCLTVSTETESLCHSVFGEEEGLELGAYYVLSVRVGDGRRFSSWSAASPPVLFDVPEADNPVPSASEPHMGKLLVEALDGRSARCWWPLVQAPEMPIGGSARGRPTLEYRLDVSRCLPGGGMERHCTVLLADEEREDLDMYGAASLAPCEARVNGLQPGGQYFASLAVRFALLGRREWRRTGITATFQTV